MDMEKRLAAYTPKPLGEKHRYAVLLPLIRSADSKEWEILYQIRSEDISQPGEVSFPGGRLEQGESFQEAAVREACEELNLTSDQITVLGEIDYIVRPERTIHCFVGQLTVNDWRSLSPNEEVARLFTIPLKDIMSNPPQYHILRSLLEENASFPFERVREGRNYNFGYTKRYIPFYNLGQENIWGMTALFTHRFTQILEESDV
ncbi:NUDIX hydrolase [Streptococcus dentiloxodontae]